MKLSELLARLEPYHPDTTVMVSEEPGGGCPIDIVRVEEQPASHKTDYQTAIILVGDNGA